MLTLGVKRTILIFSVLIIALLSLFKLSEYSILSGDLKIEWAIGAVAIIFFFIGVYLNKRSLQKQEAFRDKNDIIDEKKLEEIGLSKREYEILNEISRGLSNKEIANKLFVSESTVKTHVSNLFVKLDAKRRTQAIQKAKEMQIII